MLSHRRIAAALATAALALPAAACGEDDVQREAEEAQGQIEGVAKDLEGNLDDVSTKDLRQALQDAERTAREGSGDAKREARRLERRIERELNERN